MTIAARDQSTLSTAACELSDAARAEVVGIACDTRSNDEVNQMVGQAAVRFGGIDILVNCAGKPGRLAPQPSIDDIDETEAWSDIDVKVMGYLRCIRAVVPHMVARGGGRVVNISGVASRQTGATVRSMRNAAITALTKNLADELGVKGISVCGVHPGFVRTEATADALQARAIRENTTVQEVERQLGASNALGRIIDAEEIAGVVAFLASPRAVAINGDMIAASGGVRGWIHY